MTEHLFFIVAWLVAGGATTCALRFIGLPNIMHIHDSYCYSGSEGSYYDQTTHKLIKTHITLTCKPRLGGKPFELVLWIVWTLFWPVPVIGTILFSIIYFIAILLWQKF